MDQQEIQEALFRTSTGTFSSGLASSSNPDLPSSNPDHPSSKPRILRRHPDFPEFLRKNPTSPLGEGGLAGHTFHNHLHPPPGEGLTPPPTPSPGTWNGPLATSWNVSFSLFFVSDAYFFCTLFSNKILERF